MFQHMVKKRGTFIPRLMLDSDSNTCEFFDRPEPLCMDREAIYYDMRHEMHGVAVIINNTKFDRHDERKGSNRDEFNLTQAFIFLGYRVMVCKNFKSHEIESFFDTIDRRLELSNAKDANKVANDSFVCCMLSHGCKGAIIGSDSEPVNIQSIELSLEQSKMLESKPKMLFVQACRGDNPGRVFADGGDPDIFTSYATQEGDQAYREDDKGSWYATELSKVLCKKAKAKPLRDIQREVEEAVCKQYSYGAYKIRPTVCDQLDKNKSVHFFS